MNKEKLGIKFITSDLESLIIKKNGNYLLHVPVAITVFDGVLSKSWCVKKTIDLIVESEKILDDYLQYLILNFNNYCVFIHNFSSYDSILVLKAIYKKFKKVDLITRDNKIYKIIVKEGGSSLIFRDSYLLLPSSLRVLAENFEVENKKQLFDALEFYKESLTELELLNLVNYMENDAISLYQILTKFQQMMSQNLKFDNILESISLSSASLKFYINNYYIPNFTNYTALAPKFDKIIREGYLGGMSDVYIPYLKKGYILDINSMYPFIMRNNRFGLGEPIKLFSVPGEEVLALAHKYLIITKCLVYVSPDIYYPPIAVKYQNKMIQPTGYMECYLTSEEIKYYCRFYGDRLKIYVGFWLLYWPISDYIFKDYIDDLYNLRLKYKVENNQGVEFIIKRFMNSTYGRLGIKPQSELLLVNTEANLVKFSENNADLLLYDLSSFQDNLCMAKYKAFSPVWHKIFNIRVDYAFIIAALARLTLQRVKNIEGLKIYYLDTDSIIIDEDPLSALASRLDKEKLGFFKIEKEIEDACFIAPKCYSYKENGNFRILIKGVKTSAISNAEEIHNLMKTSIFQSKSKSSLTIPSSIIHKAIKLGEIREVNFNLTMRFEFDKRKKVLNKDCWVDTLPFHFI